MAPHPLTGSLGRAKSGLRPRQMTARARVDVVVAAVAICVVMTACADAPRSVKHTPTKQDVATIAGAVSDIVYQCQSVAAGFVASADAPSLERDVTALVHAYRRVRADAPITIGTRHTTLRQQLALAEANLDAD